MSAHPAASSPMISVIVPVRDDPVRLQKCLASLGASAFRDFETIVVDDASTQTQTADVARAAGAMVVRMETNTGPAGARNRGADVARGQILFFFDADVCVHPETVGLVAETFARAASIAACFGSYDLEPGERHFLSQYKNLFHHYVHQQGNEEASTFWSGCGAIRRDVFVAMNGFDAVRYPRPCIEDIELGARLRRAGHRILLNKQIQVTHLKRWTLIGILKSDVLDRGIPWTRLILREKNLPNDLNLGIAQRVAAMFACLVVTAVVGQAFLSGSLRHWVWIGVPAALLIIVAINWRFYAFFTRHRSILFAVRVLPVHVLYYLYSGASLAAGTLLHLFESQSGPRTPTGDKGSKGHLAEGSCPG